MSENEQPEASKEVYEKLPWDKIMSERNENEEGLESLAQGSYKWDQEVDKLASEKKPDNGDYEAQNGTSSSTDSTEQKTVEVIYSLQPEIKDTADKLGLKYNNEMDLFLRWGEKSYDGQLLRNVAKKVYGKERGAYNSWDEMDKAEKHSEVISLGFKMTDPEFEEIAECSSLTEASELIAEEIENKYEDSYTSQTIQKILREEAPEIHRDLMDPSFKRKIKNKVDKEFLKAVDPATKSLEPLVRESEEQFAGRSYNMNTTEARSRKKERKEIEEENKVPINKEVAATAAKTEDGSEYLESISS
ncbi:MAG: hypothetical protein ACLFQ8_02075 [Candidatus Aenigmatarchaeota archaeon]